MSEQQQWEVDAQEFGVHVRMGGWRLGLLVARNVEKGQRGGNTSSIFRGENGKVPAMEFARAAGTSPKRVLAYLAGWEKAAEAGIVPASTTLEPSSLYEPDADSLPSWSEFYPPVEGGRTQSPQRDVARNFAKLPPGERAEIVREAVKSDQTVRLAAAKGSRDAAEELEAQAGAKQRERAPELTNMRAFYEATTLLFRARKAYGEALEAIRNVTLADDERAALSERNDQMLAIHDWYDSCLKSGDGSFDDQLSDLLKEA